MTERAAYLLHGEDLVDCSKRREQEEPLSRFALNRCAEEHHRIDETVARLFWLCAGGFDCTHSFIFLLHHEITGDNPEIVMWWLFCLP